MKDLIERALDAAQRGGASYADVRVVERETEGLTVKNGALEAATSNSSAGFGVRVMVNGAWGFSSSANLDLEEAERIAREAVEIAEASGIAGGPPVELDDTEAVTDTLPDATRRGSVRGEPRRQARDPHGGRCGAWPASPASRSARAT